MPSRNELNMRAAAVGLDPSTIANDSKLEQKVLYLEKNSSTVTGTAPTTTLTSSGTASNGETFTIGSRVYTLRTALTGATYATGVLTSTGTAPSDGDTVTVGSTTYTFRTTLSTSPRTRNEVLIGVSAAVALDNLKLAINGITSMTVTSASATVGAIYSNGAALVTVNATISGSTTLTVVSTNDSAMAASGTLTKVSGTGDATITYSAYVGAGIEFSPNTLPNAFVTATTNTNTEQTVQAVGTGVVFNGIDLSESAATLSWGSPGLTGGANGTPNEILIGGSASITLDNIKSAINGTGTPGTDYSAETVRHPHVTAGAKDATTLVIASTNTNSSGALATTTTMANFSFTGAALSAGTLGAVAQNTATYNGPAGVSGDRNTSL